MCDSSLLYLCARSLFHRDGRWREGYKHWTVTVSPSREIRCAFGLSLTLWKLPCLQSPSPTPLLLYQMTNCYAEQHTGTSMVCQYLIYSLTQSPLSFHPCTHTHTHKHTHIAHPKKDSPPCYLQASLCGYVFFQSQSVYTSTDTETLQYKKNTSLFLND